MEAKVLMLLENHPSPMTKIREVVMRSSCRECEKVAYAVKLINIARKHNLI